MYPLRYRFSNDKRPIDSTELSRRKTIISVLNNLRDFIASSDSNQLYGPQMEVVRSISENFERGNLDGYVNLPTGFGKGVILALLAEAMRVDCCIVTSRVKLVEDLAKSFQRFTAQEPGLVHAGINQRDKGITIGTYNAYRDGKLPQNPLLFFDEAHNILGEKTSEKIQNDSALIKIGLTASDEYTEDRTVKNVLPTLMHNIEIEDAVRMGLCCPFSVTLAETGIDGTSLPKDKQRWAREVNSEAILRTIVEIHKKFNTGKKAMVCCNFVGQTEVLTQMFQEAGITASFVHSKQSRREQSKSIARHVAGDVEVLNGIKIPGEGHDDAEVEIVYFAGAVDSSVKVIQFAGRALRVNESKPNKTANIVHVTNPGSFGITYPEAVGTTGIQSNIPAGTIAVPNSAYGASIVVRPTDIFTLVNKDLISHGLPDLLLQEGSWFNEARLRSELGVHYMPKINKYLNMMLGGLTPRELHLVQKVKKAANGRWAPHFHPWIFGKLKTMFEELNTWPEGYCDINFLAGALQRSPQELKDEIERREKAKRLPLFERKEGARPSGRVITLYPESLLPSLEDYRKWPPLPKDQKWYTIKDFGIKNREHFMSFVERYSVREEHPDWFGHFSSATGRNTEYFAQELKDFRQQKRKEFDEVNAEGDKWYTRNRLAELGVVGGTNNSPLELFANEFQLRESFPQWFKGHSGKKQNFLYYHEEFVTAFLSQQKPATWRTKNEVVQVLKEQGISKYILDKAMAEITISYPELKTEYYFNEHNNFSECLSPDLIELVIREFM